MASEALEVVAEIQAAAARAEATPDPYLEQVRAAAARLAAGAGGASDVRSAALLLEHQAVIDVDVPTASRIPPVAVLKKVVKKLTVWYFRFVGQQVTLQGQAAARLGTATAARIEELEAEVAALKARVADLEGRAGA